MDKIKKTALDRDLKSVRGLEIATREPGLRLGKLEIGLAVLVAVFLYALFGVDAIGGNMLVVAAAVIGAYMALNIGANDVANTMGPAVGSGALTMTGALVIAVIFDASGALIAGGDVVSTVSKGIIDIAAVGSADTFMWAMLGALMAAAVWVNLATYVGAPVSTTHAIVGGVMGAGIAAASFGAVNWPVMAKIAASWVISPLLGGIIAALILLCIKRCVIFRDDKIRQARRWVPVFVAIMASVFSVYLVMKGLKRLWTPGPLILTAIGGAAFFAGWAIVHPMVDRASRGLENNRKAVASLFTVPLICATALLAFAHGANDVANAIGPLAAIISVAAGGDISAEVAIPPWVMIIGAVGIGAGLVLFGPKLIRAVGQKITKLDIVRAYAVALAAAITVIVASGLGLPVSSTHVAIGAIFGVGFLRERLATKDMIRVAANAHALRHARAGKGGEAPELSQAERKALKKLRKRRLVKRRFMFGIIAAWFITVPLAALLGAMFFFMIRGMLLP